MDKLTFILRTNTKYHQQKEYKFESSEDLQNFALQNIGPELLCSARVLRGDDCIQYATFRVATDSDGNKTLSQDNI